MCGFAKIVNRNGKKNGNYWTQIVKVAIRKKKDKHKERYRLQRIQKAENEYKNHYQ